MSGLLRGALNLIQGESTSSSSHPLIGTQVEVGSIHLRVDSVIAEGGFAVVFAAYDSSNRWFALKRQIAKDNESVEAVVREIRIFKQLSGHQSILGFIAAAQMKIPSGGIEFMLLTELCSGGTVADRMKNTNFSIEQALKIFHSAAMAVCHMHDRVVPITHRDVKIENLLFSGKGHVKLCDFGSATTQIVCPDETWSLSRRTQLEEEMQRHTTPMYRAPEILDTYQNFVVGPQQDIWALGCVLFYLCYHVHPFEDSAKLRILNVAYSIPSGFEEFCDILPLIESCLKVDPVSRPVAKDLVERTEALAVAIDIDLTKPVSNIDSAVMKRPQGQKQVGLSNLPPPRPPPPRNSVINEDVTEQASAVFGAIKGQGLSLLKNLKDRSTAVVQKVQSKLVSQEVTWVTSRLCLIPLGKNTHDQGDEEEWNSRVMSTGRQYAIFNMTSKPLRANYGIKPLSCSLTSIHPQVPPTLENILMVCSSIVIFLRNRPGAAAILLGSEAQCVVIAAALLIYCKLIVDANDANDFVANKRRTAQRFSPSHMHILDLVKNLTSPASFVLLPIDRPMSLRSISLSSLPILSGVRNGLRPIIEIFQSDSKIWDSSSSRCPLMKSQSSFEVKVGDVQLNGQITLFLFYFSTESFDSTSKRLLFSLVFHTSEAVEQLSFTRSELDINQTDESHVPSDFRITLSLRAVSRDNNLNRNSSPHFSDVLRAGTPELLVIDSEEQRQIMDWYSVSSEHSVSAEASRSDVFVEDFRNPSNKKSGFFETLDWSQAQQRNSIISQSPPPSYNEARQETVDSFSSYVTSPVESPETINLGISHQNAHQLQHSYDVTEENQRHGCQTSICIGENATQHCFDDDKETPILSAVTPPRAPIKEFNLLDLDTDTSVSEESVHPRTSDPFSNLLKQSCRTSPLPTVHTSGDLLEEWTTSNNVLTSGTVSSIHRNVSAPAFNPALPVNFDPFADFLCQSSSNPTSAHASASNSGSTTPKPTRPNYSRAAFENLNANASVKSKISSDAFGDLLTTQGFTASSKNLNRTLGDLQKAEEIKDMDPVTIKIREWVCGKQRNIRALLGSLDSILWEGADSWQQPRMADLLSASQVKRNYYKACLLVHPDKQVGKPHEKLARAIFTELNDAWNAFEQAGCQSL